MTRRRLILAALLLLTGCRALSDLNDRVRRYQGAPLDCADCPTKDGGQ